MKILSKLIRLLLIMFEKFDFLNYKCKYYSLTGDDRRETAGKKEWLRLKPKRMRTIFTVEQLERMESEFDKQQYMVGADRYDTQKLF